MDSPRTLHIICHDIPWPVDYGGVVDLYYKIRALSEEGIKIRLHCFLYHRPEQAELAKYCETVNYYQRKTGLRGFSLTTPYIVNSRANDELLHNLLRDDHPVLMEGIHCSAFLPQLLKANRRVFLRLHNVESVYYSQLLRYEKNLFKKIYFLNESIFLRKYEKRIPDDLPVFAVAPNDAAYYKDIFEKNNVRYLPVFIPHSDVRGNTGMGNYCLYHGNLSVGENRKAVTWLLHKVFSKINIPLVIAGKNPSSSLTRDAHRFKHACVVANPGDKELNDLISKAHIHLLPSFNQTGIKLKLINALFNGRHCVVNDAAVEGTGLEGACYIGNTPEAFASLISQLYRQPFTEDEIRIRKAILSEQFDNIINARRLIQWIW